MSGFFAELQRRKVYRVAVAYIVAGGFIIQIASAVFPAWDLPSWSQRLMIVLVLAGFPIALISPGPLMSLPPASSGHQKRKRPRKQFRHVAGAT